MAKYAEGYLRSLSYDELKDLYEKEMASDTATAVMEPPVQQVTPQGPSQVTPSWLSQGPLPAAPEGRSVSQALRGDLGIGRKGALDLLGQEKDYTTATGVGRSPKPKVKMIQGFPHTVGTSVPTITKPVAPTAGPALVMPKGSALDYNSLGQIIEPPRRQFKMPPLEETVDGKAVEDAMKFFEPRFYGGKGGKFKKPGRKAPEGEWQPEGWRGWKRELQEAKGKVLETTALDIITHLPGSALVGMNDIRRKIYETAKDKLEKGDYGPTSQYQMTPMGGYMHVQYPTTRSGLVKTIKDYEKREELGEGVIAGVMSGVADLPGYMGEMAAGGIGEVRGVPQAMAFSAKMLGIQFGRIEDSLGRQMDKGQRGYMALAKAVGDVYIENLSETAGAGFSKVAKNLPFAGKILTGMEEYFVGKGMAPNAFWKRVGTKVGYNGLLGEWGEERLGTYMRALVNVDDFGAGPGASADQRIIAGLGEDLQFWNQVREVGVLATPAAARQVGQFVTRGRAGEIPPDLTAGPVVTEAEAFKKEAEAGAFEGSIQQGVDFLRKAMDKGDVKSEDVPPLIDMLRNLRTKLEEKKKQPDLNEQELAQIGQLEAELAQIETLLGDEASTEATEAPQPEGEITPPTGVSHIDMTRNVQGMLIAVRGPDALKVKNRLRLELDDEQRLYVQNKMQEYGDAAWKELGDEERVVQLNEWVDEAISPPVEPTEAPETPVVGETTPEGEIARPEPQKQPEATSLDLNQQEREMARLTIKHLTEGLTDDERRRLDVLKAEYYRQHPDALKEEDVAEPHVEVKTPSWNQVIVPRLTEEERQDVLKAIGALKEGKEREDERGEIPREEPKRKPDETTDRQNRIIALGLLPNRTPDQQKILDRLIAEERGVKGEIAPPPAVQEPERPTEQPPTPPVTGKTKEHDETKKDWQLSKRDYVEKYTSYEARHKAISKRLQYNPDRENPEVTGDDLETVLEKRGYKIISKRDLTVTNPEGALTEIHYRNTQGEDKYAYILNVQRDIDWGTEESFISDKELSQVDINAEFIRRRHEYRTFMEETRKVVPQSYFKMISAAIEEGKPVSSDTYKSWWNTLAVPYLLNSIKKGMSNGYIVDEKTILILKKKIDEWSGDTDFYRDSAETAKWIIDKYESGMSQAPPAPPVKGKVETPAVQQAQAGETGLTEAKQTRAVTAPIESIIVTGDIVTIVDSPSTAHLADVAGKQGKVIDIQSIRGKPVSWAVEIDGEEFIIDTPKDIQTVKGQTYEAEEETVTEPAPSAEVRERKPREAEFEPTGQLDPTKPEDAEEIIKLHKSHLGREQPYALEGIYETGWEEGKRVIKGVEYTTEQVDTAYRTVQQVVDSPIEDVSLFALPGKEKEMAALGQKMTRIKPKKPTAKKVPTLPKAKALPKVGKNQAAHVKAVALARAVEAGRYAINGLYVDGNKLVATDGRRLFIAKGKWGKSGLYMDVAAQNKGELGKTQGKEYETEEGGKVGFPKYEDIIPEYDEADAIILRDFDTVWRRVSQASAMLSSESFGMTVVFNKDKSFGFAVHAPEVGHAEINVNPGGKILGGLNPRFFMDVLRFHAIRGDKEIKLYFPYPDRPMYTTSRDGKSQTVMMPINVREPAEGLKKALGIEKPKVEKKTEKAKADTDKYSQLLQDNFPNITEEQALATVAYINAVAENQGLTLDEWWKKYIKDIKKDITPNGGVILYQPSDVFFTKSEEVISKKMPNKMPAQSFKNWLKKQGIKDDEMKWTGLDDLITQGKPITKEQALETIRTNNVQLEEVVKGEVSQEGKGTETDLHVINERVSELNQKLMGWRTKLRGIADTVPGYLTEEQRTRIGTAPILESQIRWATSPEIAPEDVSLNAIDDLKEIFEGVRDVDLDELATINSEYRDAKEQQRELQDTLSGQTSQTQFAQYTLPGGENYREVLITLPVVSEADKEQIAELKEQYEKLSAERDRIEATIDREHPNSWTAEDKRNVKRSNAIAIERSDIHNKIQMLEIGASKDRYTSPHWAEKNVLAHVRLTDRTSEDGKKVLFIEEIQSDWHQTGREKGYKEEWKDLPVGWKMNKRTDGYWEILNDVGDNVYTESFIKNATEEQAKKEALTYFSFKSGQSGKVPQAPFKKNWHELVFKRVLRYAAEGDYDAVAWTTGEQQAERYPGEMRKVVDAIKWESGVNYLGEGQKKDFRTVSLEKNGKEIGLLYVDAKKGEVTGGRGDLPSQIMHKPLSDVIGGKMADQILQQETGEIAGEDFVVGNKGMWLFYDQILPSFAKKYTKKWGVKGVGEEKIATWEEPTVEAGKLKPSPIKKETVHSIPVTDAMVDSVLAGQPMYQVSRKGKKAAVEFLDDGRAILYAFENHDFSSLVHELGHIFRRQITGENQRVLEKWAGVQDGKWTRKAEEKVARGFERYLRDGKAPSSKLKEVFQKFKEWLMDIYRTITGSPIDINITPDVRKAFDSLVETDIKPITKEEKNQLRKKGFSVKDILAMEPEEARARIAGDFTDDPTIEGEGKGEPGFAGVAGRPGGKVKKPWLDLEKTKSPDKDIEDFFGRTKRPPYSKKASSLLEKIEVSIRERFEFAWRIPKTKDNAIYVDMIRTMPEERRAARELAIKHIIEVLDGDGTVKALDSAGLDLLRRKVFVQDLLYEAEIDRSVSGNLEIEKLKAEDKRLDGLIAKVPSVQKAYQARQALWKEVSADLLERGVLDEEAAKNQAYVRHFVLDLAEKNRPTGFLRKRLSAPYRAYSKHRKGSKRDISTDYLEVETKALADIYADNAVEDTANNIAELADKRKQYTRMAKAENFENLVGGPEVVDRINVLRRQLRETARQRDKETLKLRKFWIEELTAIDPTYPFRQRIAMHMSRFKKLAYIEGMDYELEEDSQLFKDLARAAREQAKEPEGLAARGVFKAMAERTKLIKESLGKEYVTPERVAQRDGYVEYHYKRPNLFYRAQTITQAQIAAFVENNAAEAAEMLNIPVEKMHEALVMGRRKGWIIPDYLAAQLDDLPVNKRSGYVVRSFTKPFVQFWKRWVLRVNPFRYNARNMLGDTERFTVSGQEAAIPYIPKAMKMLILKEGDEYDLMRRHGVVSSSLWHEMNDVSRMKEFERFKNYSTPKTFNAAVKATFALPIRLVSHVGSVEQNLTQFREDILRAAVFLYNYDTLKKGERVRHWAGKVADINEIAKVDKARAAAKLSRETLGDYGKFTPFENDVLRQGLLPFYSWLKINTGFWMHVPIQAAKEGKGKQVGASVARIAALNIPKWLVRALWIYGAMYLWNHRDEEEEQREASLPFWLRSMPHVNIGDWTIWGQTALSDFVEWFDMERLAGIQWRYDAGFLTKKEAALEAARVIAEAPVNKIYQAFNPYMKAPITAITGMETWPNVFQPRFVAQPASRKALERAMLNIMGGDAKKFYQSATGERKFEDTLYAYFSGWWGRPSDVDTFISDVERTKAWTSLKTESKTTGRKAGQAKKGKEAEWQEARVRQKALEKRPGYTQNKAIEAQREVAIDNLLKQYPTLAELRQALRKTMTQTGATRKGMEKRQALLRSAIRNYNKGSK